MEKWCKSRVYIQVRCVKRKCTEVLLCRRFKPSEKPAFSAVCEWRKFLALAPLWLWLIRTRRRWRLAKREWSFQLELNPASRLDLYFCSREHGNHWQRRTHRLARESARSTGCFLRHSITLGFHRALF